MYSMRVSVSLSKPVFDYNATYSSSTVDYLEDLKHYSVCPWKKTAKKGIK